MLSFKLRYKSATGQQYDEEIIVDMSEIKGTSQLGTPNLYSIAKSLEKMEGNIGHIVSGFKLVKADIYSSEDPGTREDVNEVAVGRAEETE